MLFVIQREQVQAATLPIANIAAGRIISVNGRQFVKIGDDENKGSRFVAITQVTYCQGNGSDGVMQSWTQASCDNLTTPTGTNFTQGPCLTDNRDGKKYEIRKFADGKCWMVDNLAYGGTTTPNGVIDACAGKFTYPGGGQATLYASWYQGSTQLYGDCRDTSDSPWCASIGRCGYFYNYQAAMQKAGAYNGNLCGAACYGSIQGICPVGWHLPAQDDFLYLTAAVGGIAGNESACSGAHCAFWDINGGWKAARAGNVQIGGLSAQGGRDDIMGSTEINATWVSFLHLAGIYNIFPSGSMGKSESSLPVRCLKDYSCPANCSACSNSSTCTACATGYTLDGGVCRSAVDGMNMQDFTSAYCDAFATPAAAGYTPVGTLVDSRDGKSYEVRKFADGKCWMVDNLMYGGASDNCAGVDDMSFANLYGGSSGMAAYSNRFGAGTYGNCRDPRVDGSAPCTAGSTTCGYLYNWQAAMQLPSAYNGASVSYPNGTPSITNFHQGICPTGWHLPSGGNAAATSEFAQLDIANGGTGNYQPSCTSASCNFWLSGYGYKGVYAGYAYNDGWLEAQGTDLSQWSANQQSASDSWVLYMWDGNIDPGTTYNTRDYGYTVRCVKN